jgi:hypothetical protein
MLRLRNLLLAALVVAACSEGNDELKLGDLSTGDDMMSMQPDDLGMPDMYTPQCGDIVRCLVTCGITNIACDQMCVTGADPMAIQAAGALALCAATNCLNLDGGISGGNQLAIFTCLFKQCQSQVAMCPNLLGS